MVEAVSGLSVRGLTVERAGRVVLEDASFSAPAGSVTAVLGLAGAGKTSLMAGIAGLLPVARGAVFRGGDEITRLPAGRRGIGLLAPGSALPWGRTLQASLHRMAGRGGAASADDRLSALGLSELAARPPDRLSHGEQALALTAARLLPPGGVLLVDEAGMGLDDEAQRQLSQLLRLEAAGGRLVLLATRSSALAAAADHLILLSHGRVLQSGTPASLYAEPFCAVAARMTGAANILAGTVRELRPQSFVWTAGTRHVQAADPHVARPVLGGPVALCLRPERISLLGETGTADNVADAAITDVRSAGPLLEVSAIARLGPLLLAVPSCGVAPYPAAGQQVRIGWAANAAQILI